MALKKIRPVLCNDKGCRLADLSEMACDMQDPTVASSSSIIPLKRIKRKIVKKKAKRTRRKAIKGRGRTKRRYNKKRKLVGRGKKRQRKGRRGQKKR